MSSLSRHNQSIFEIELMKILDVIHQVGCHHLHGSILQVMSSSCVD